MKPITTNSTLRPLLLIAVMLFASVASYADYVEVDGLRYRLTGDSTASFYGAGFVGDYSFPSPDVAIPPSITYQAKNYSVTQIDNYAFYGRSDVKSVTIPETVTMLGNQVFTSCTSLEKISLPNSITSLSAEIFSGCKSLKSVVLGEGIKVIPEKTFYKCVNLRSVTFPTQLTSIGEEAFGGCTSLLVPDSTLPQSLTSIGGWAFSRCSSLKTFTVPQSVTSIGDSAFYECSSLKTFTVPRNATSLGKGMLQGCTSLESLTVLPDLLSLPNYFCAGCTSLTKVELVGNLHYTGDYSFAGCSSLEEITLPITMTDWGYSAIDNYSFAGCSNLKRLNNSTGKWRTIGIGAFKNCISLTTLPVSDETKIISWGAFQGCTGLIDVAIPDNVTEIWSNAFLDCTNLVKVTLGMGLAKVGKDIFAGCNKLDTVVLNTKHMPNEELTDGEKPIVTSWFGDVKIKNLIIGDSVTIIPAYFMKDQINLRQINCGASLYGFCSHAFDGCINLKTINHTRRFWVEKCALANTGIEKFKFEDIEGTGKYVLEDSSFYNCKALKSIEFSANANYALIGKSAFEGCSALTEVVFPMAIEIFAENCFKNCTSLASITVHKNFKQFGVGTFVGCPIKSFYIFKVDVPTNPLYTWIHTGDAFDDEVFTNATLYVPKNCKAKYQADAYWGKFQKIVEMNWDSIDEINADSTTGSMMIYTLDGRPVMNADAKSLPAGIYIINGKKTLVR